MQRVVVDLAGEADIAALRQGLLVERRQGRVGYALCVTACGAYHIELIRRDIVAVHEREVLSVR